MTLLSSIALAMAMAVMPADNFQAVGGAPSPEDFAIVSDKTSEGVRTIVAMPSQLVCSRRFDIRIDAATAKIKSIVITGGCPGNSKAVAALLEGLTVQQAVAKLDGIPCGRRGTSCADQISRVLKKAYGIK